MGDTTHHEDCWRDHHECATAELARLRSVVAGVEAVADDLEIDAESSAHPRSTTDVTWNAVRRAKRSIARRLRSVLSDTTGGTS